MQVVVAGALIVDRALLVAQRQRPPDLAGLWELPGGKVAPGETEVTALARELREELGVDVVVGERTVDVHIRRLRKALEPQQLDGMVQTVRGSGYRFSETP
jgi:mutator protein MutT